MSKRYIQLSPEDRKELERLSHQQTLQVNKHKRVSALLSFDKGLSIARVGKEVGYTYPTLRTLIDRYEAIGLKALSDKPRSGRPAKISGLDRAKITALACSEPPEGYQRWTLRLLSDRAVELGITEQISHVHIGTILQKTSSSPTVKSSGVLAR